MQGEDMLAASLLLWLRNGGARYERVVHQHICVKMMSSWNGMPLVALIHFATDAQGIFLRVALRGAPILVYFIITNLLPGLYTGWPLGSFCSSWPYSRDALHNSCPLYWHFLALGRTST